MKVHNAILSGKIRSLLPVLRREGDLSMVDHDGDAAALIQMESLVIAAFLGTFPRYHKVTKVGSF